MFIQFGNRHINLRHVVEIRERSHTSGEDNITVVLQDGSSHSGFLTENALSALSEEIIPAQPGYEAYREYDLDLDFGDSEALPATLEWKPVVAFIYSPDHGILEPITAEDGRLNRFAVRQPNGRVYTSHETFFDDVDAYGANLAKELAKVRAA